MTPGSDGYQILETDLGKMTLSLQDIKPYANGSRVALQFGNLTSATVNGAKATIEWGRVDQSGTPQNDSAKTREVSFPTSLRSGAWNTISIVLEGVPPAELGFVRVKTVTHTGISLHR